jgi:flagellar biosynthesis protein FliP
VSTGRTIISIAICVACLALPGHAQDATRNTPFASPAAPAPAPAGTGAGAAAPANALPVPDLTKYIPMADTPRQISSSIQVLLVLTVLALAPSILVMMTSFTRIIVVLGLLRQAMATQQLPPNQVLIGLALFMTFVVMAPVYSKVHDTAIEPYLNGTMTQGQAMDTGVGHVREFMINQVEAGGNTDDVYLFLDPQIAAKQSLVWSDVPTLTLVPAFVVSELKVSFLMGFRIYLPFLVIDMVIASILISMGMLMLPPVLISLPFKLLLFVLVDGWRLVVRTLMVSFT